MSLLLLKCVKFCKKRLFRYVVIHCQSLSQNRHVAAQEGQHFAGAILLWWAVKLTLLLLLVPNSWHMQIVRWSQSRTYLFFLHAIQKHLHLFRYLPSLFLSIFDSWICMTAYFHWFLRADFLVPSFRQTSNSITLENWGCSRGNFCLVEWAPYVRVYASLRSVSFCLFPVRPSRTHECIYLSTCCVPE